MTTDLLWTYEDELGVDMKLAPSVFVPLMLGLGFAIMLLGNRICSPADCPEVFVLSAACYVFAGVVWALCGRHEQLARWATAIFVGLALYLLCVWIFGVYGIILIVLPIALSSCLLGVTGPFVLALLSTIVLVWDPTGLLGGEPLALSTALVAVWSMPIVLLFVRRPMAHLVDWSWRYYRVARSALEHARDRQVELREALQDLADANAQMAILNNKLLELREVAERAERTKTAFLSKVSHEFRTPLNMIIGLTDVALQTPEIYGSAFSPRLHEHLEIVNRNCQHLASLVDDVLDLSQVETGRFVMRRSHVHIVDIINRGVDVVHPLIRQKGLDLQVDVPANLPLAYCDRTRIAQVVVNLLSNSARFTDVGGITVTAQGRDDELVISVADTGPGISPEDQAVIFEPFCQGIAGRNRDRGGSGLGLSVSKQFIELHGGRIWVESELGKGSAFFFTLPTTQPRPVHGRPGHWIVPEMIERGSRRPRSGPRPKERLLVCDLSGGLAALAGRASDGAELYLVPSLEALAGELDRHAASAVLVNSPTPNDAWALASSLRTGMADTPIFATCVEPPTKRALAAGASGYLVKPVSRKQLETVLSSGDRMRRILVVDDEPDELEVFALQLHAIDAALEVSSAQSGTEALDSLRDTRPDLVLLDLVMPDLSGWEVLAAMRSDPGLAGVPCWIVSAEDPVDRPPTSDLLLTTIRGGLPAGRLADLSLSVAKLLQSDAGR